MALPLGAASGAAAFAASKFAGANAKTWRDRLKDAVYTSPVTGTKIKFDFTDVSRGFDIRGTKFDFPGVDDSYVQQNGYSSREYPLVCYFSGKNCDIQATAFEATLLETGTGKLQHPIYGTIPVVPFGRVERNDALVTAANQSVVTVTFFTTVGAIYPSSQANAQNEFSSALAAFNAAAAAQFGSGVPNLKPLSNALAAIGTIKKFLNTVRKALAKISDTVTSIRAAEASAFAAINGGLDVLIGQPLQLALQISNLIQAPGKALTGIESRLDSYAALATSIFGDNAANPGRALSAGSILLANQTKVANDFHISSLFALSAVSGSLVSVMAQPITAASQGVSAAASTFSTRTQVIAAAAAVLDQMDQLVSWRDQGYSDLGTVTTTPANYQIDTGEAYQALQQAAALTVGYLVNASFSLIPERSIVLARPRTIVDLCAELYGSVDDKLDLLISTNNLSGDEILELPQGRRIVYYPAAA
jgi:prophage DNA circulation protein